MYVPGYLCFDIPRVSGYVRPFGIRASIQTILTFPDRVAGVVCTQQHSDAMQQETEAPILLGYRAHRRTLQLILPYRTAYSMLEVSNSTT